MYILIVTGLSGAGKTGALNVLEDMGFVCADNMPCQLLGEYLALCESSENVIDKVAIVIDSRESHFGYNPQKAFSEIKHLPYKYEIMFLECEDAVLQRRYSETRRLHPMHDDVSIGISLERDMLVPLKEDATYIIDTSNMRPQELSRAVEEKLGNDVNLSMRLIVSSFGFKRGIPGNADFVFDIRLVGGEFITQLFRDGKGPVVIRNFFCPPKHDHTFEIQRPAVFCRLALINHTEADTAVPPQCVRAMANGTTVKVQTPVLLAIEVV